MSRLSPLGLSIILLLALAAPARAADVTVTPDAGAGFVVENNAGSVERLRVDEATGNLSRNGALFVHTTGTINLFVGAGAGNLATNSSANSAFGNQALYSNTTGDTNSAFGGGALQSNTTGAGNSAVGFFSLTNNTTGSYSSAVGHSALHTNTTGSYNSAFGHQGLFANTTGYRNSAFGERALVSNTTGPRNSAFGNGALASNTTGARNVAVGPSAGTNQTTGNDNIYLANLGVAGESGQIKIGNVGTHTQATIAGIHGSTSASGIAVLVNASGVLGTTTSSVRFKEAVRDMGQASDVLMQLRPVVFRYRKDVVADAEDLEQYGLVAEEVVKVAPGLVANDAEGRPYSVRYHVLPALLLNELQQQQRTIDALLARVAELEQGPGATASGEAER